MEKVFREPWEDVVHQYCSEISLSSFGSLHMEFGVICGFVVGSGTSSWTTVCAAHTPSEWHKWGIYLHAFGLGRLRVIFWMGAVMVYCFVMFSHAF